jgi:hypothetical protein
LKISMRSCDKNNETPDSVGWHKHRRARGGFDEGELDVGIEQAISDSEHARQSVFCGGANPATDS